MASRTTRNKIRFQAKSAFEDMVRVQDHLAGIAALADDRSPHIDNNLPQIILAQETVMQAFEKFMEGL
ncbi:MAG: hypothetical protein GF409_00580 [Candidatus Omnitrophica bacterium]|nr:hypothetical protein [Candidatus Omnitrophota bacterium]